jgi:hypothetical protein
MVLASPDYDNIIAGLVKVIDEAEQRIAEQKRVVHGRRQGAIVRRRRTQDGRLHDRSV